MLQPVPRGTVLWVVGKLFFTALTRDFFVQVITLRAYLELVGAFFKEKSRFHLPFPPGMSAAGAEAGQSRARVTGCSPTAAAMSLLWPGERAPLFSFLLGFFTIWGWAQLPGQRWGVPGGCGCSGKGTA